MARIFNRIRKDLLSAQKFRKYLVYAVGEIILVVVGILIALQINNWNQERQQTAEFYSVLSIIREELTQDTAEVAAVLDVYKKKEPIYRRVLNDSASAEDYQSFEWSGLIMNYAPMTVEKQGYERLSALSNTDDPQYDSLKLALSTFYSYYLDRIEEDRSKVTNDYLKNVESWKQNKAILYDIWTQRPAGIDYLLHSDDYKGRVLFHRSLIYRNYLPRLDAFRNDATDLINHIDSVLAR